MNRTKYAMRNIITMFLTYVMTLGLSFIVRSIFINKLGSQYLGLSGVFSSILSVLSVSDLGLESVFAFLLYKPLAQNNQNQISNFIVIFRKIYTGVGIFIFISGLCILPFLPNIIGSQGEGLEDVTLIYLIMLFNSAISYFFTYNRTILDANQKNYIITSVTFFANSVVSLLQIYYLYAISSMVVYVFLTLLATVTTNVVLTLYVFKEYPFLKKIKTKSYISSSDKKTLIQNTVGGISNKLGSIVVFASDNIILSMFVNLSTVGLYSNYTMILSSITGLIQKILGTLTASVGNLSIESLEKSKAFYKKINFIVTIIAFFVAPQLLTLLRPLVSLWIGEKFVLSQYVVLLIVINFVLQISRYPSLMYIDAYGLQWVQKWKSPIEAILNIVFSLIAILVFDLGLAGVILSTILSTALFVLWYEPFVVVRYALHIEKKQQAIEVAKIIFEKAWLVFPTLLTWIIMHNFYGQGITLLIKLSLVNFIVILFSFFIVFRNNDTIQSILKKGIKK